jgi:hypothetical protein
LLAHGSCTVLRYKLFSPEAIHEIKYTALLAAETQWVLGLGNCIFSQNIDLIGYSYESFININTEVLNLRKLVKQLFGQFVPDL